MFYFKIKPEKEQSNCKVSRRKDKKQNLIFKKAALLFLRISIILRNHQLNQSEIFLKNEKKITHSMSKKENIITNIKKIIRESYMQLYDNKFNNLDEMDNLKSTIYQN